MSKDIRVSHPIHNLLPKKIKGFNSPADPIFRGNVDDRIRARRQELNHVRQLAGTPGGYIDSAAVPAARPPADFTARGIPHCENVAVPLESAQILWQR